MHDYSTTSENELALILDSARTELVTINERRAACIQRMTDAQAEIQRRKGARDAETYDERRRAAAARGDPPPKPPKQGTARPAPLAASVRLTGLTIPVGKPGTRPASGSRTLIGALEKPPAELSVSDHAIVRYLERVVGFDVDAIPSTRIGPGPKSDAFARARPATHRPDDPHRRRGLTRPPLRRRPAII